LVKPNEKKFATIKENSSFRRIYLDMAFSTPTFFTSYESNEFLRFKYTQRYALYVGI
jgi:hypothetical protein